MASQKYLKIGGALANYSDAHPVNISKTTSSPKQCDFYMQMLQGDTWPAVGKSVEWFRRDDTRVFRGAISKVDPVEMWEGGNRAYIHVTASGLDDRLFRRTTWNRGALAAGEPARCAQYRSYAGTVDTAGTAVSWVSVVVAGEETSNRFGPELAGKTIQVNGTSKVVSTVDSPEHLTLTSSAGTHSSVAYSYTLYSGDVVKDLLQSGAYPSGALGGGYCEFEGFTWSGSSIQQGAAITNKGLLFDPPQYIHDAIQNILDNNPNFYFAVDDNQVAYFAVRTLVAAPGDFTPVSGQQKRNIQVSITAEDVRNVEISATPYSAVQPTDDPFTGDGSARSWFTTLPIHDVVGVTLNGVSKSFADGDSTSAADFYFTQNAKGFWIDPLAPAPLAGDAIVVSYRPLFYDLIEYEDAAAVASRAAIEGSGSGRFEKYIDRTTFLGKVDAYQDATNSVNRLKDNYYSIDISTFEVGYDIGQSLTLTVPQLQLAAASLFIDEMSMTDANTKGTRYDFEYTLKLISISRRITELQVLRDTFSPHPPITSGGIASGGGSSTAPPLPAPPGDFTIGTVTATWVNVDA